jgi:hypothetical protein
MCSLISLSDIGKARERKSERERARQSSWDTIENGDFIHCRKPRQKQNARQPTLRKIIKEKFLPLARRILVQERVEGF